MKKVYSAKDIKANTMLYTAIALTGFSINDASTRLLINGFIDNHPSVHSWAEWKTAGNLAECFLLFKINQLNKF